MLKKGDTLVEVAIAIGIFSLVAIAVTSVMNSSSSDAQLALETTLAREEIDAQAEALRFVHDSYASERQGSDQPIYKLWEAAVNRSIDASSSSINIDEVLQYAPLSCDEIFNNQDIKDSAFVINTRDLNGGEDALIPYSATTFTAPSTYPRLIYDDNANLYSENLGNNLTSVEGIYVLPVAPNLNNPEYFDFYIRTCWYGGGTKDPSTISTVIRLYNSDQITLNATYHFTATLDYSPINRKVQIDRTKSLDFSPHSAAETRDGYALIGWCTKPVSGETCPGESYDTDEVFYSKEKNKHYNFYAIWRAHYWFDVNVFVNTIHTGTYGGYDDLPFLAYVNGKQLFCDPNHPYRKCASGRLGDEKLRDLYQEVPDGQSIKLVFLKVPGRYISNTSSICNNLQGTGCHVTQTSDSYVVELVMDPKYLNKAKDSSGHYTIQIEPVWKKS